MELAVVPSVRRDTVIADAVISSPYNVPSSPPIVPDVTASESSVVAAMVFRPTPNEVAEADTPRLLKALEGWYERLNELSVYREEHGDSEYLALAPGVFCTPPRPPSLIPLRFFSTSSSGTSELCQKPKPRDVGTSRYGRRRSVGDPSRLADEL